MRFAREEILQVAEDVGRYVFYYVVRVWAVYCTYVCSPTSLTKK